MAGLDPAIHVFLVRPKDVDARDKPGHDDVEPVFSGHAVFAAFNPSRVSRMRYPFRPDNGLCASYYIVI